MGQHGKPAEDRRARFAEEYAKDLNGTNAAIRAGYSKRSAHVTASRLLREPDVIARLAKILKRASDAAGITVERTQQEIARVAFGDRRKLWDENGQLRSPRDLDEETAALLSSVESEELFAGRGEERVSIGFTRKVKTWDKVRALDQCMSILGMHKTRDLGEDSALNLTIRLSSDRGRRG